MAQGHPRFAKARDRALVLWLIGTHHGFGRPFFDFVDLDRLADRVRYVGSPEHKNAPSFAGPPRLRADASCCPREMAGKRERIDEWLREAFRSGAVTRPESTRDTPCAGTNGSPVSRRRMPFRFETEWIEADGIRGSELSATWASLLIGVDDEIVTCVVDERARTVRNHI